MVNMSNNNLEYMFSYDIIYENAAKSFWMVHNSSMQIDIRSSLKICALQELFYINQRHFNAVGY